MTDFYEQVFYIKIILIVAQKKQSVVFNMRQFLMKLIVTDCQLVVINKILKESLSRYLH